MTVDVIAMNSDSSLSGYHALEPAYPNFKRKPHLDLEVAQIVLGVLCIISGIVAKCVDAHYRLVPIGILGGAVVSVHVSCI